MTSDVVHVLCRCGHTWLQHPPQLPDAGHCVICDDCITFIPQHRKGSDVDELIRQTDDYVNQVAEIHFGVSPTIRASTWVPGDPDPRYTPDDGPPYILGVDDPPGWPKREYELVQHKFQNEILLAAALLALAAAVAVIIAFGGRP